MYIGRNERGKRRHLTRTLKADDNRTGRRQAEKILAGLVVEAEQRRDEILHPAPVDATATVEQLLDLWYEARLAHWSPKQAESARSHIDRHLIPRIGHRRIDEVRPEEIERMYRRLGEDGGRGGGPLKSSSVRRVHTTLHSAFAQAEKWGTIEANPMRRVTPPPEGKSEVEPPTPAEVHRAMAATRDDQPMLHLFIVLAATTGCRRGELAGLQWGDLDPDGATIEVQRGVIATRGKIEAKRPKTGRSRVVSLDPSALALLEGWRRRQQTEALAQGVGRLRSSGWVFAFDHTTETPPRPDWGTRAWTRLRGEIGLDHVRLHDFRHFTATHLLGAGVDVGTVADRLGHSRASTTTDIYRHHLPARDREAATIMGDIIDAGGAS